MILMDIARSKCPNVDFSSERLCKHKKSHFLFFCGYGW